jgi:hypothetical protein
MVKHICVKTYKLQIYTPWMGIYDRISYLKVDMGILFRW